MGTSVGVGRSLNHDGVRAGRDAAEQAMAEVSGEASVVLVFASAAHDQQPMLDAIVGVVGDVPLAGCTGEGVITRHGSDECSHVVAVMAIASDVLTFRTCAAPEFGEDSTAAGRSLARALAPHAKPSDLLVLFPDGLRGDCRQLIAAVEDGLDEAPRIVGGTAGDLFDFEKTYQYRDGQALSDGVTGLLIGGDFDASIVVSHGCDLVGEPQVITKTDGCFVEEVDGQACWELFKGYLDDGADDLQAMHIAHLLLAEKIAEPDDPHFEDFVVRVPVRLDADRGALYFAAGLAEGTTVQVALRNPEKVCERAEAAAGRLIAERGRPAFVLQLDCAGRGRLLLDETTTERIIEPVQRAVGKDVPWMGLHTYGEIAPVGSRTMFHNYTGVLCALYPNDG